ncbi:hypothetical protein D3C74_319080 [compost metagenome]
MVTVLGIKELPAGMLSNTTTSVAFETDVFSTSTEYVIVSPTIAFCSLAVFVAVITGVLILICNAKESTR